MILAKFSKLEMDRGLNLHCSKNNSEINKYMLTLSKRVLDISCHELIKCFNLVSNLSSVTRLYFESK